MRSLSQSDNDNDSDSDSDSDSTKESYKRPRNSAITDIVVRPLQSSVRILVTYTKKSDSDSDSDSDDDSERYRSDVKALVLQKNKPMMSIEELARYG